MFFCIFWRNRGKIKHTENFSKKRRLGKNGNRLKEVPKNRPENGKKPQQLKNIAFARQYCKVCSLAHGAR